MRGVDVRQAEDGDVLELHQALGRPRAGRGVAGAHRKTKGAAASIPDRRARPKR